MAIGDIKKSFLKSDEEENNVLWSTCHKFYFLNYNKLYSILGHKSQVEKFNIFSFL